MSNELIVDYHRKLSVPLVGLVFVLLGSAQRQVRQRRNLLGVGLAIGIALLYYVAGAFCRTLGQKGLLHRFWAGPTGSFSL